MLKLSLINVALREATQKNNWTTNLLLLKELSVEYFKLTTLLALIIRAAHRLNIASSDRAVLL